MDKREGSFIESYYESLVFGLINSTRELYRYLGLTEKAFEEIKEYQLDPINNDDGEGLSEWEINILNQYHSTNTFDDIHFPEEFCKSFVISVYAKIEKDLLDLCERSELKLVVSPYDSESLKTGIFRAHRFLAQSAGYYIDDCLWQEVQNIGRIRNRLVHNETPYIASAQKSKDSNNNKIHVKSGSLSRDYYLHMDSGFYEHISKFNLLKYCGAYPAPNYPYAGFVIEPSYEYCRYLVDFRKRLFLNIYKGFLEIAKSS